MQTPAAASASVSPNRNTLSLAIFLYGATTGGASRRALTLASEFAARGHRVDLVLVNANSPLHGEIDRRIHQVILNGRFAAPHWLRASKRRGLRASIPALAHYLRTARPDVLMSAANSGHASAVLAHSLSGSPAKLVLRICTHLSGATAGRTRPPRPMARIAARLLFGRADLVIAGSDDVARDIERLSGIAPERIRRIYNPIVGPDTESRTQQPIDHPWFAQGEPPVILSVGRFVAQKDYPTLLRAFARVRAQRPARLLILGEARKERRREQLLEMADELGLAQDVALPGHVDNPLAYMSRAAVFALSSSWEGLPGVLIEALASGCPVVTTDSPGGSSEIVDAGKYGRLVPTRDPEALANALLATLDEPRQEDRQKRRAADFSVDASAEHYLDALTRVARA